MACEELEWGCVLLLLLPATLLGPGVVLPSLCITDCESVIGDGKPNRVSDHAGAG